MSMKTIRACKVHDRLDSTERARLTACEDVIATAKHWAVEEAKALLVIKQRKLWRGG